MKLDKLNFLFIRAVLRIQVPKIQDFFSKNVLKKNISIFNTTLVLAQMIDKSNLNFKLVGKLGTSMRIILTKTQLFGNFSGYKE